MKRLIVRHGERVVRHELGDQPVTIGRDLNCDLFFSDHRLSRQHCRIQATPEGVRYEDLGSRNGSFMDSKRVEIVNLMPNETVHLGGLVLSYEDDSPSTGLGEDETVMLEESAPDEDKTAKLKERPSEPTPKRSSPAAAPPDPPQDDKTQILPVEPAKPAKSGLPKTRLLDANALKVAADKIERGASDTMLLTRDAPPPRQSSQAPRAPQALPAPSRPVEAPMPEDGIASSKRRGWLASLSWSAKLLFLVSSVAFLVYFVLAYPLVRTLGNSLREESLRRGRTLLSLVAAANGNAVGEGRIRDASVDNILREERVKETLLLDLEGNVLAPPSRADEVLTTIDGINAELGDIRTFYLGRRGPDYVMVQPLLHRGRRVGFAVLVYEAATASASWATAVLFLAFLVLILGVVSALVFGKRMTLEPLSSFRDDIEAVVKGDSDSVPPQQGFAELSDLAKSVNRLIARAFTVSATPPAQPAPGQPLPVVQVPDAPPAPIARPARVAETSAKRPVTAAIETTLLPDAKFWVDENFIVVRADDEAAALVGSTATEMEGQHLIEAVGDQKLLEVILDTVNALEKLPAAETTAELPGGSTLQVTASRDRDHGSTVVGLRRL